MESTTGFQFCKTSDDYIEVCSFISSKSTRYDIRCHTGENREEDEEFVLSTKSVDYGDS